MCYKFKPLLQIFKLFYRGWGGYRVYNNVFIYFLNHTETSLRTGTGHCFERRKSCRFGKGSYKAKRDSEL